MGKKKEKKAYFSGLLAFPLTCGVRFMMSITSWRILAVKTSFCLACLLSVSVLVGCYRRVCPAYASYFIVDDSVRREMFSLFVSDSIPKPAPKDKKKWTGLLVRVSDRKRAKQARTIVTRVVYPPAPSAEPPPEDYQPEDPSVTIESVDIEEDPASSTDAFLTEELEEAEDTDEITADAIDGAEDPEETAVDALDEAETPEEITVDTLGLVDGQEETAPAQLYRYGYDPSDNFNQEQVFYNQLFGHLFLISEDEVQEEIQTQDSVGAGFDEVPDIYVEGDFVDDTPEGLEDFTLEGAEDTEGDEPNKKSKKRRERKKKKKKDRSTPNKATPAVEEVVEEETPSDEEPDEKPSDVPNTSPDQVEPE